MTRHTDGRTDGRQTVALRLPLNEASLTRDRIDGLRDTGIEISGRSTPL